MWGEIDGLDTERAISFAARHGYLLDKLERDKGCDVHPAISDHIDEIAAICRRFHVARLAVFGSAARSIDFDVARSDADLLVEFDEFEGRDPYLDLKSELEKVLQRPVDLLDSDALEESRNHIRKAAIRQDAQTIYGS